MKLGNLSTIPIPRDNILCHFCSYNVIEMRTFCVGMPPLHCLREIFFLIYISMIRIRLDICNSLLQVDHQVGIGLYFTEPIAL